MIRESIFADDGRELNVFRSAVRAGMPAVVVALPFGARHSMLSRAYAALHARFDVITWESRFLLDVERDEDSSAFDACLHARDLASVIRATAPAARADVLGYCSGAGVALLAARLAPEAISRLVLVGGEYLPSTAHAEPTDIQRQMDIFLSLAARSRTLAGSIQEKLAASAERTRNEFQVTEPFSSDRHLHRYGINYLAYRAIDMAEVARQVAHPALTVVSGSDLHVAAAGSMAIGALLPGHAGSVGVTGDHYELCRGNPELVAHIGAFLGAREAAPA
ncbi:MULTISPECIES: alpha/beta hydrolase [unclassified Burkholderia]|uniref:alpha/beta hydrolase n=1 Tax=unclassified Burkholderia TaxID=2613784 RepID=UPI001422F894|nr:MULTISPECIES: alpha/beta hydrolase [unclassified Burkholderia]NIE83549.1 alpha/beta hydrolase [Burkholderia sp. Tr-860]NIF62393.1 alpha/beta hydrolase [Burkholderia sp. Cy-647]NIF94282.1 alpha/beta hydrolase [Burkholderia sp. Ax-1720]